MLMWHYKEQTNFNGMNAVGGWDRQIRRISIGLLFVVVIYFGSISNYQIRFDPMLTL